MANTNLVTILEQMQRNREQMQQNQNVLMKHLTVLMERLKTNKNRQQHDELPLTRDISSRNNSPPDQKTTIPMEKLIDQANELVDWLVTIDESQDLLFGTPPIYDEYPNDEDDVNTLTDKFETKLEYLENFPNFDEDFVSDLLSFSSNITNTLYMEVRVDLLMQTKLLCLTNNDVLRYNYND